MRYNAQELALTQRSLTPVTTAGANFQEAQPSTSVLSSGQWRAVPVGGRTIVGWGEKSMVRFCIKIARSSQSDTLAIVYAFLLACASYTGFYMNPTAAPARVSLAFLTFLMVLNNVNGVLSRLPQLEDPTAHQEERVWLIDFLFGTMIFNFSTLLEFGLVSYGLLHKSSRAVEVAAVALSGTGKPERRVSTSDVIGSLAGLDHVFRWLFPLGYLCFVSIMFAINGLYTAGPTTCEYDNVRAVAGSFG
jgi:hypothetical protein